MKTLYLFVNTTTFTVDFVINAFSPDMYEDNSIVGAHLIKLITSEESPENIISHWHWDGETFQTHETSPGKNYSWDKTSTTWILLPSAITTEYQKKVQSIKELREAKDIENISYTGLSLQVGFKDQNNITGRLDALAAAVALNQTVPETTLFWRDADNVNHFWTDVSTYTNWLLGLVIAYADRREALYIRSWEHGANLKAIFNSTSLTDEEKITALLTYDITTGW